MADDFDDVLLAMLQSAVQKSKDNTRTYYSETSEFEKASRTDEQWGLCPELPIPAYGIEAEYEYVEKLTRDDGKQISWTRSGSMYSQLYGLMLDIHVGTDADGESYGPVYINMYAKENTDRAPKGFKLSAPVVSENDALTRQMEEFENMIRSLFGKNGGGENGGENSGSDGGGEM